MMVYIFEKGIKDLFQNVERMLINKENIIEVHYRNKDSDSFPELNEDLIEMVSNKNILYCIWTKRVDEDFKIRYIGHSASKVSKRRIKNHLCKKHHKTGAKLEEIKEELKSCNTIGYSFVEIKPGCMRLALEEWLIQKNSINLDWNKNSKKS